MRGGGLLGYGLVWVWRRGGEGRGLWGEVLAELLGAGGEDEVEELAHAEISIRIRFLERISLCIAATSIYFRMTRQRRYAENDNSFSIRRPTFLLFLRYDELTSDHMSPS